MRHDRASAGLYVYPYLEIWREQNKNGTITIKIDVTPT